MITTLVTTVVSTAVASLAFAGAVGAASVSTITEPVNLTACPDDAPTLTNGGFERFSDPDENPNLASTGRTIIGRWHSYAGGPNQILFLDPGLGTGEDEHYVRGWKTTSRYIEIQRQVATYTSSINAGGGKGYSGPPKSGKATEATTAAGGAYFHWYMPQAAQGEFWAELNALDVGVLYQDIKVPSAARVFWSIKHRGRTAQRQDQMYVKIGRPGAALVQQSSIVRYGPTNADKFSGTPVYGAGTPVSTIRTSLTDGWVRYEGMFNPSTNPNAAPTRSLRFQLEAANGANFGNMLDDIRVTPLYACPFERDVILGETDTLDVLGRVHPDSTARVSYGLRHSLESIGNAVGPSGTGAGPGVDASTEFATSGNDVVFTPTKAGRYRVDYQVVMEFNGVKYSAASRIKYNVITDRNQSTVDVNEDGVPDTFDRNWDGIPDDADFDGDGVPDTVDLDGDGVPDAIDRNGDGVPDAGTGASRGLSQTGVSVVPWLVLAAVSMVGGLLLTRRGSRRRVT